MQSLIQRLSEKLSLSPTQARATLESVLDGIADVLVADGQLRLSDFGAFEVKKRKARNGA